MQDLSWRELLCAVLLVASVDCSGDLSNGNVTSSNGRSGLPDDSDNSYESKAIDEAEAIAAAIAILQSNHDVEADKRRNNPELDDPARGIAYNLGVEENSYIAPSGNPSVVKDAKSAILTNQFIDPVVHDELVFPKDPTLESAGKTNEYPYSVENSTAPEALGSILQSSLFNKEHKLFTRLIPIEERVLLHKIPGAENAIQCEQEGELHNFWAPGLQCMVCVCLAAYGRLRPACVSCQACMLPPEPPTTRHPPYTTPEPTQPPVPDNVSCSPLPVGVPVQSPLDPCKICVCSETVDQFGRVDVRIDCKHNPQCVLPTTPPPVITTPVPQHVCDKFPPNVRFPHPLDACKVCRCIPGPYERQRQVVCDLSPECQPTTRVPPTPPPPPTPPSPTTDLPGPEICSRYPENVLFPHPHDRCQVCKCTVQSTLLYDKKTVTCFILPNCNPETESPPPVTTVIPEPDCNGQPENVWFSEPTDPCLYCQCTRDYSNFIAVIKKNCVPIPGCGTPSTNRPPISTPGPVTPPPQPDNVRCAPLPVNTPFQSPINPCQVCVCTEDVDPYGRIDVNIECQENPQCVLPQNQTTLPPDIIITARPLPACKNYPENVLFPHPHDQCQVCRCYSVPDARGVREQMIDCYTKPECLTTPTPPPPPTTPGQKSICDFQPLDQYFPDPSDPCRVCKCHRDHYSPDTQLICFVRPECAPTTRSPPTPTNPSCYPLPVGRPFQHPLQPCQTCTCSEIPLPYGGVDVRIDCRDNQQCVLPPDHTTLQPDIIDPVKLKECRYFPENVYFPHPEDPCELCKCNVVADTFNRQELVISCIVKPECLPSPPPPPPPTPPPSTETPPEPVQICDRYPDKVIFQDPLDECKMCRCYRVGYQRAISCFLKPDCIPTSSTTQNPAPIIASCAPLPAGKPFQSPANPCQTCVCSERSDLFGRHEVTIDCSFNPQCVAPPVTPTIPPVIVIPIRWQVCKQYPLNVFFPHPTDACSKCKCSVQSNNYGQPETAVGCVTIPECLPTPPPPPISTEAPVPDNICRAPYGTLAPDPNDPCRVCKCDLVESNRPDRRPEEKISCFILPECRVNPTTDNIRPQDLCRRRPVNTPFDDPTDLCRVCTCVLRSGSSPGQAPWDARPRVRLVCRVKPECEIQPPTSPTPPPYFPCDYRDVDIPFTDPVDPCKVCVCYYGPGSGPSSGSSSGELGHYLPTKQMRCSVKPECLPPSPPTTPTPSPDISRTDSTCDYREVDVPFTDPADPCRLCVCYYGPGSGPGSGPGIGSSSQAESFLPKKLMKCSLKPECYPLTPEPQTKDVTCDPMKPGVPYPSPLNPCAICVCSESVDAYGRADVKIKCQENPQCVLPPDHSTLPPIEPTSPTPLPACKNFPPNVVFPHPRDPCLACKCIEDLTRWGQAEQTVICFDSYDNPQCVRPHTTTPGPWPPVPPPGPLPGPAPHESCAPYQPGAPFQHPWDECQVCVCTEAISTGRITIEVNCYTSPSCCYEPPYDSPGSGAIAGAGPASANLISGSSDPKLIAPPGSIVLPTSGTSLRNNGAVFGGAGDIRRDQEGDIIASQNIVSGGPQIKYISEGPLSQFLKGTSSVANIGSSSGPIIRPGGTNIGNIGSYSGNIIRPGGGNIGSLGPIGTIIRPNGPMLGNNMPSSGSIIRPGAGNIGNIITSHGNSIRSDGEQIYYPPPVQFIGMDDEKRIDFIKQIDGYKDGEWIMKPSGISGENYPKQNLHYSLKPEGAGGTYENVMTGPHIISGYPIPPPGQLYSIKMRTKSGKPKDNDTEDYD